MRIGLSEYATANGREPERISWCLHPCDVCEGSRKSVEFEFADCGAALSTVCGPLIRRRAISVGPYDEQSTVLVLGVLALLRYFPTMMGIVGDRPAMS